MVVRDELLPRQHEHGPRGGLWRPVAMVSLVAVVAFIQALGTGSTASAKGKILNVGPPKRYLLTIDGNYTFNESGTVSSGTISAPNIKVDIISVPGTGLRIAMGKGNGRVEDRVVVTSTCDVRATVSFSMFVGPAGLGATDALAASNQNPLIFPSAGGTLVRADSGNLTYRISFTLKKR